MTDSYLFLGNSILIGLLIIIVAWQVVRLNKLDKVRKEFFSSGIRKDLEEILVDQNRNLTRLSKDTRELSERLTDLTLLNQKNLRRIGFVRFNPFEDAGGNISFALALLDAEDNGVVISSLHGRGGTRIYAKSIKQGTSEYKLTQEEVEAIKKAK